MDALLPAQESQWERTREGQEAGSCAAGVKGEAAGRANGRQGRLYGDRDGLDPPR